MSANPTLPGNFDDHRYAARSLRRNRGRARERLGYSPATPLVGTRPSPAIGSRSESIRWHTDAHPSTHRIPIRYSSENIGSRCRFAFNRKILPTTVSTR
ncbi:hypothetical protein USDA257_p04430 (plasmid) [Sinorhizobium fredii USDA 257]|uniref:Uncharacterized protein n=1 Tax=Sinorhizobium fredii (strain USDA 257) TaxID=1185652 RepID=I3XH02_SINF2|nr:hypothetical protein USDA257_p04430 [Sinorhizobium fredii USDA 257]